ASFNRDDAKLFVVTLVGTLAANVVTVAVVAIAIILARRWIGPTSSHGRHPALLWFAAVGWRRCPARWHTRQPASRTWHAAARGSARSSNQAAFRMGITSRPWSYRPTMELPADHAAADAAPGGRCCLSEP